MIRPFRSPWRGLGSLATSARLSARLLLSLCFALILLPAIPVHATPEWQSKLEPFVDGLVTTIMDQSAVAGAVVTVVSSDRVLLSKGYRIADATTSTTVDPEVHRFPVASITKVFTAIAILQLAEEGKLSLDDSIRQHLDGIELDDRLGAITIAHLLSHTAGFEERDLGYIALAPELPARSRAEQLSAVLPRQVRPPGDAIAYSNAGYALLGEIVAQVSGQAYEDYVKEHVLWPLGMTRSGFLVQPATEETHAGAGEAASSEPVRSHVWTSGRYVPTNHPPMQAHHAASGGLAASANDMGRFLQAQLRQGRLGATQALTPALVDRLRAPAYPDRPEFAARALGYWIESWAGRTVFVHGGTALGVHSIIAVVPSLDVAVFVAANSANGSALTGLPRRLMRELINPERRTGAEPVSCPASCLSEYEGTFLNTRRNHTRFDKVLAMDAAPLTVAAAGNGALVASGLGYSRRLHAVGPDRFETVDGDMRLGFRRDAGGRVDLAYIDGGLATFDRADFWTLPISFNTGAIAAILGCFLSIVAMLAQFRSDRTRAWRLVPLVVIWTVLILTGLVTADYLAGHPRIIYDPEPGWLLWLFTGLTWLAAVATLVAAGRLSVEWIRGGLGLFAMASHSLAVMAFVWALAVLWQWNVLTFDPLW